MEFSLCFKGFWLVCSEDGCIRVLRKGRVCREEEASRIYRRAKKRASVLQALAPWICSTQCCYDGDMMA